MLTQQITPKSCSLACLESFLRENGVEVDQKQIIEDFPAECYRGDKENVGLLHSGNLWKLGKKYGFSVQDCDTQKYKEKIDDSVFLKLFSASKDRQTILIATRKWQKKGDTITNEQHCLRFLRLDGDREIVALEPKDGIEKNFTFDDLRVFESWLYLLTLNS